MSVEISSRTQEFFEGPRVIHEENAPYWSKHFKELKGEAMASKAKKFVELRCIRYVADDNEYMERASFVCLPRNTEEEVVDEYTDRVFEKKPAGSDYNSTIYTITKDGDRFECNCQGWRHVEAGKGAISPRSDGCQCSHVLALFLEFKVDKSIRFKNETLSGVDS